MNELQEAVLDTLMVADQIGHEIREPGPLRLAARALHAAGLLGHTDAAQVAREPGAFLGFPPVLCTAVEAATRTIRSLDDCRKLTITLFSEIPPRRETPRPSSADTIAIVRWSLERVPALSPGLPKPADEAFAALDRFLDGKAPRETDLDRLTAGLETAIDRVPPANGEFTAGRLALHAHYFALCALLRHRRGEEPTDNACRVTRDVARLIGMVEGVAGAIPYCLGLARKVGL